MGNYEQLKQAVSNVIKNNGNMEITGDILQNTLLSIISTVGGNATFAGIATPSTNPGTPDQNVFYLASQNGTYSNFGGVTLTDEVAIFSNKNGNWVKQDSGIAAVSELENKTPSYIAPVEYLNGKYNGFVKELFIPNIDVTHEYMITNISRNNPTWGYGLYIRDITDNKLIFSKSNLSIDENGIFDDDSGIKAVFDWSVIDEGANTQDASILLKNDIIIDITKTKYIFNSEFKQKYDSINPITIIDCSKGSIDGFISSGRSSSFGDKGSIVLGSQYNGKLSLPIKVEKGDNLIVKINVNLGDAGIIAALYNSEETTPTTLIQPIIDSQKAGIYNIKLDYDGYVRVSWVNSDTEFSAVLQKFINVSDLKNNVDVLKDDVRDINSVIEKIEEIKKYDISILDETGYYNFLDKKIGDLAPTSIVPLEGYYAKILPVYKGQTVKLVSYTTSSSIGYGRGYCIVDDNYIIKDIADAKNIYDYRDGITLEIKENGFLYVNCQEGYKDIFSVEIITYPDASECKEAYTYVSYEKEKLNKKNNVVRKSVFQNDSIQLDNPIRIKGRCNINFMAVVDDTDIFTEITIGRKYTYTITPTTITCNRKNDTQNFGFTIEKYLLISINYDWTLGETIKITTFSGEYEYNDNGGEVKDAYGQVSCSITGSLYNLSLSFDIRDITKPIWMLSHSDTQFGSQGNNRWPYYLLDDNGEIKSMLVNAYNSCNSQGAYDDLLRLLNYGTPKKLFWHINGNDGLGDEALKKYKKYVEQVKYICIKYNIELILSTMNGSEDDRNGAVDNRCGLVNEYVRNSGFRYVDFAQSCCNKDGVVNEELIGDKVHTNTKGAYVRYVKAITDFPELVI